MKNLEAFKQICAGPVWDGDLVSKDGRDALVKAGYVARRDGWNLLTVDGVDVAVTFGLLSTNRPSRVPYDARFDVERERLIAGVIDQIPLMITSIRSSDSRFAETKFREHSVVVTESVFRIFPDDTCRLRHGVWIKCVGKTHDHAGRYSIQFQPFQALTA